MKICGDQGSPLQTVMHAEVPVAAPPYSRTNPFPAKLRVNRPLSGPESAKDTRHFEIDLTGWGLSFEVGDSFAVYATNDPQLVEEIIHALGATGKEEVPRPKGLPTTFREALLRDYSITQPTPKFLKAIAHRANAAPLLGDLLAPERRQDLTTYLWGMEVIDFLIEHPSAHFRPEEFVGLLTKLQPRLYSVASSLKAYPEQVHFIVDVVRYESHGRIRKGVCSSFLAERADDCTGASFPQHCEAFSFTGGCSIITGGPREPERGCCPRDIAGTQGDWSPEELALFRIAASKGAILLYGEEFDDLKRKGSRTMTPGHATKPGRFMSSIGWERVPPRFGNGSMPMGPFFRVRTRSEWRQRRRCQCCAKCTRQGDKSLIRLTNTYRSCKSDKRYKRDVY